jgi:Flp pilus assembly protein protease CpaA
VIPLLIPNFLLATYIDISSRRIPNLLIAVTSLEILLVRISSGGAARGLAVLIVMASAREIFGLRIGYGDIKFMAALTLASDNFISVLRFLNYSLLFALLGFLLFSLARRKWLKSVPMAPFLCLAAIFTYL